MKTVYHKKHRIKLDSNVTLHNQMSPTQCELRIE